MNRRDFSRLVGATTLGAWSFGPISLNSIAGEQAASIPLEGRGVFRVGDRPVFLVSGSVDYFRCPPELWRDRLVKAKRGGLNCIASCIMWNFHEAEDGVFDFAGDRDIGRFIDLCGELGLYFFARVGPFVCDEWDGGGHPAWLIAKEDIQFRALHAPTLKYVRRWFEHLLPILVSRQTSRGGPVLLVQQENEYYYADRPDGRDYQTTLVKWMRELGVEVTITDCNGFDTRVPGSLQTINGFSLAAVEHYRQDRAELPVVVSELYTGYLECWGQQPAITPPELLRAQLMELLASRVMYNYFMYHGGTNFGFWASTSWQTDYAFVTTCYYPYGPLAEGGGFSELFYTAKAANHLATNFQEFFCQSAPVPSPVKSRGTIHVSALNSPAGTMIFVLPAKDAGDKPGVLELSSGESISLADTSASPMMVPCSFLARAGCRIDWANATLLGVSGPDAKPFLVFAGGKSLTGRASINGQVVEFGFGTKEPDLHESSGAVVVGVSHELAGRVWFADGRVIIGCDYVGERSGNRHECWLHSGERVVHVLEADGQHRREVVVAPSVPSGKFALPKWESYILPELKGGGNGWQSIEAGKSLEQLGVYQGYAWYRASFKSEVARSSTLQFSRAADRFHVFLDGKPYGVWGRGARATRDPLPIELIAGNNDFIILCDNMGHSSEGRAKERKGILGPVVVDSKSRNIGPAQRLTVDEAPTENFEFKTYRANNPGQFGGWAWTVVGTPNERLLLTLREVPQYAWIRVNGEIIGEHGGNFSLVNGFSFKEFILPPRNASSPIRIELLLYGGELANPEQHVFLFSFPDQTGLVDWHFKAWENPRLEAVPTPGSPVWWRCDLPKPDLPGPVFLHLVGLSKGQAYLNGRPVGRYWHIGPQKTLYLPEPWWEAHNVLEIFDEEGRNPESVFIERDSRVPAIMKLI